MTNIEILRSFKNVAEKLKSMPLNPNYFVKEDKRLEKSNKKYKELDESLRMTKEKMNQKFTI